MTTIGVIVNGALGRMGQTVLGAVAEASGVTLLGGADAAAADRVMTVAGRFDNLPLRRDIRDLINETNPQVVVDFTSAEGAMSAIRVAVPEKVRVVSGSTGLTHVEFDQVRDLVEKYGVGVILASNFALGAVMLGHLASIAARHFEYADLIESHHELKADSPSGTALSLVSAMLHGRQTPFKSTISNKETLDGTRGGVSGGVNVHSARMPGRIARHEIVFGTQGQTLTLVHDTVNRDCYMPGVIKAIEHVVTIETLIVGLQQVLGFNATPGNP